MSRIESLTDEQKARFAEFLDRWTKIGLCTEPADRPRAEAAIRDMYRQGGLEPPKRIVWCGSPLSLVLTPIVILDDSLLKRVGANFGASVQASVRACVGERPKKSFWDRVRDSIRGRASARIEDSDGAGAGDSDGTCVIHSVWTKVVKSVETNVRDSIEASVWDSIKFRTGDSVLDSVQDSILLESDLVWFDALASIEDSVNRLDDVRLLAVYRYFYEVANLTGQTSKISGLWELAQSAGWALPHENICWVSERPRLLARDDRGRLHSLSGPACAYPDGWAVYAVHGVRVPAYVIERPHEISVQRIATERNGEVQRVMMERYCLGDKMCGATAFMHDAGATQLDHDERHGTLWRCDVRRDEPIVMVEMLGTTREPDGSFKRYWLRVHPELRPLLGDDQLGPAQAQTVRNAIASTFGLVGEQYVPVIDA